MTKQTITLDVDIPDGYEAVDYRVANEGDIILMGDHAQTWETFNSTTFRYVILKKSIPKEIPLNTSLTHREALLLFHLTNSDNTDMMEYLEFAGISDKDTRELVKHSYTLWQKVGEPVDEFFQEHYGIETDDLIVEGILD